MPAWVRLRLDLTTFDPAPYREYAERARTDGITFTSLAALGDTAEHRHRLYQLNKTCSADIPERGEFFTYDEYVATRLDVPAFRADGVLLALDGPDWVGLSMVSLHPGDGCAFNDMTGLLRDYRGRGLSLALKLLAVDFARRSGLPVLRTMHHPANASAIAMNRRLGFVDDDPERAGI
ncbi:GNAT family N-acetyltransferase [Kribbella sp. CA-247076]|uniref:GNAT family N-acetyltransferase n=1 Tax=Kribbella sp. CA-247076 TaxID=3239941 RepID=UPI003D8CAAA7